MCEMNERSASAQIACVRCRAPCAHVRVAGGVLPCGRPHSLQPRDKRNDICMRNSTTAAHASQRGCVRLVHTFGFGMGIYGSPALAIGYPSRNIITTLVCNILPRVPHPPRHWAVHHPLRARARHDEGGSREPKGMCQACAHLRVWDGDLRIACARHWLPLAQHHLHARVQLPPASTSSSSALGGAPSSSTCAVTISHGRPS